MDFGPSTIFAALSVVALVSVRLRKRRRDFEGIDASVRLASAVKSSSNSYYFVRHGFSQANHARVVSSVLDRDVWNLHEEGVTDVSTRTVRVLKALIVSFMFFFFVFLFSSHARSRRTTTVVCPSSCVPHSNARPKLPSSSSTLSVPTKTNEKIQSWTDV